MTNYLVTGGSGFVGARLIRRLVAAGEQARLVWGAGDTTILPELVTAVRKGRAAWIGGMRHRTDTTHVDNVVEGLLLAALSGPGRSGPRADCRTRGDRAHLAAARRTAAGLHEPVAVRPRVHDRHHQSSH